MAVTDHTACPALRRLERLVAEGRLAPLHLRFARRLGQLDPAPGEALYLAAALLSHQVMAGAGYLSLSEAGELAPVRGQMVPRCPDWLALLRRSPIVGDGRSRRTPLVLDPAQARLYLYRDWLAQRRLGGQLRARAALWRVPPPAPVRAALARWCSAEPDQAWRRLIAANAVARRLTVIGEGVRGLEQTLAEVLGVLRELFPRLRLGLAAVTAAGALELRAALRSAQANGVRGLPAQVSLLQGLLSGRRAGTERELQALDCLVLHTGAGIEPGPLSELLQELPVRARLVLGGGLGGLGSALPAALWRPLGPQTQVTDFPADFADWLGQCGCPRGPA